jgi:hypothetical protein
MIRVLGLLLANVMVFVLVSVGYADMKVIGTATYMGSDYNLIWDDDNNGKSIVWLDYTNDANTWANQMAWAASLGDDLAINLDGYTVRWDEDEWRLPTTMDGIYEYGYDGTTTGGYNITSSEMGHLYYEELGNLGYYDINGNYQAGYGLQETEDFENLIPSWYWSGTEYTYDPGLNQGFTMALGFQGTSGKSEGLSGLAVRSGRVSAVRVPGAVWLLLVESSDSLD